MNEDLEYTNLCKESSLKGAYATSAQLILGGWDFSVFIEPLERPGWLFYVRNKDLPIIKHRIAHVTRVDEDAAPYRENAAALVRAMDGVEGFTTSPPASRKVRT